MQRARLHPCAAMKQTTCKGYLARYVHYAETSLRAWMFLGISCEPTSHTSLPSLCPPYGWKLMIQGIQACAFTPSLSSHPLCFSLLARERTDRTLLSCADSRVGGSTRLRLCAVEEPLTKSTISRYLFTSIKIFSSRLIALTASG